MRAPRAVPLRTHVHALPHSLQRDCRTGADPLGPTTLQEGHYVYELGENISSRCECGEWGVQRRTAPGHSCDAGFLVRGGEALL